VYGNVSEIPGIRELWELTLGDPRVVIAVLDGPVDLSHPCFEGADLACLPAAVPAAADGGPASQHGTRVTSLIFGQHHSPIQGVAPRCRGLILPIFSDRDDGSIAPCSETDLARALLLAAEAGAQIINVSGGEFSPSGSAHPILADTVRECADRGILIVVAAGNEGCRCLHIPGALPSVLAVGAMDPDGEPYAYSNWGYGTQGILAPVVGEGAADHSGTSFAAPIVSGIVGLFLSLQTQRGLHPSAEKVRDAMLSSAEGCDDQSLESCDRLLAGRLMISATLKLMTQGVAPMSGPQSVNVDNRNPLAGEPSPVNTAAKGATGQVESQAGVGFSSGSGSHQASAGPGPAVTPQSWTGSSLECDPGSTLATPRAFGSSASSTLDPGVVPSACTYSGNGEGLQKVFALGKLSFDYGTRARRSYFTDSMFKFFHGGDTSKPSPNIDDPSNFIRYISAQDESAHYIIQHGNAFPNRNEVTAFNWILTIDDTPVYAIVPGGPFAFEIHDTLVAFLRDEQPRAPYEGYDLRLMYSVNDVNSIPTEGKNLIIVANVQNVLHFRIFDADGKRVVDTDENQLPDKAPQIAKLKSLPSGLWGVSELPQSDKAKVISAVTSIVSNTVFGHGAERVSIPGLINGQVRLFTGEVVPVIFPDLRGMFSWRTDALVKATKDAAQASDDGAQALTELLNRIYFETRNLGVTSADRALNYAVTNALLLQGIIKNVSDDKRLSDYTLDTFEVERSPICRPDADCWDVKFVFYNPENILKSRRISRFTVDVSDVVPTMIGERKDWFTR